MTEELFERDTATKNFKWVAFFMEPERYLLEVIIAMDVHPLNCIDYCLLASVRVTSCLKLVFD